MPTVETNGVETYYERRGDGPPVVFLHGAGADHRVWAEVAAPLADDYTVVTPDLRLHGRTGGGADPAPSFDAYVADLRALVDALDLDRPAIVGFSMGGMIAQAYAARHPEDVAALVTLGALTPTPRSREEWLLWNLVFPVAHRLRTHLGDRFADRFLATVMRLRRDDAVESDMAERERIEREHAAEYPEQTVDQKRAVRAALDGYGDRTIDYATLSMPFRYAYGAHEMSTLETHAAHVEATAPRAAAVEVPSARHHSHVDNPGFVVDVIYEFLDAHHRSL